jgi:hypothetical protein
MKPRKILINILNDIKNLTYENHSIFVIKQICETNGLKEGKLGRWTKKKKIDDWIENQVLDNKEMREYSYILEPINGLDLLIQLGKGYYLGFNFIKSKTNIPIYTGLIDRKYIYVFTSKQNKQTIYYKMKHIFDEDKIENFLMEYYKEISFITNKHNVGLTKALNQHHITSYCLKSSSIIIPLTNNHAIYFNESLKRDRMKEVIEDCVRNMVSWERKSECIKSAKLLSE